MRNSTIKADEDKYWETLERQNGGTDYELSLYNLLTAWVHALPIKNIIIFLNT
jgi:hypothetical protein